GCLLGDRHTTRSTLLMPAWIVFASLAVLPGGLFHRHYWVTLTFPLALAGGVAIGRVKAWVAIPGVCLAVIPWVVGSAHIIALDRDDVAIQAHDDPRLRVDESVARWYNDHRTPAATLYVIGR